MNARETGAQGERIALAFLEERGMALIEKNYRAKGGEIDLVMRDGKEIAFVEVKYRLSDTRGNALQAIDERKRARIRNAAEAYCAKKNVPNSISVRCAAVLIDEREGKRHIEYIEDIFL